VLFNGANAGLKTAQVNKVLKNNKIDSALFLYGDAEIGKNLPKSVRNIKNVKSLDFKAINAYDILKFDFLMLEEKLFGNLKEVIA
jgi:ribosomal protein L4